jgi:hypothetical protein
MFELLLQADKALADGDLDQAERTYWQLMELDPTNAIAVAGLARVSLERGDERLAKALADRALRMDPDSVAAQRVAEALEHKSGRKIKFDVSDLTLAAERLEALGKRKRNPDEGGASTGNEAEAPDARATARAEPAEPAGTEPTEPAEPAGPEGAEAAAAEGEAAAAAAAAAGESEPESDEPCVEGVDAHGRPCPEPSRSRADQGRAPVEPLGRGRMGRIAAAAAAAGALARTPVHADEHEAQATDASGRRPAPKRGPIDPFAAAEMAAAIEAVGEIDLEAEPEAAGPEAKAIGTKAVEAEAVDPHVVEPSDPEGEQAVEPSAQAEEDDTVAMRLALIGNLVGDPGLAAAPEQGAVVGGDRADAVAEPDTTPRTEDRAEAALKEALDTVMDASRPAPGGARWTPGAGPEESTTMAGSDDDPGSDTAGSQSEEQNGEERDAHRKKGFLGRLRGS